MAWTSPATWSVAEVVTASKMNTHVRDNLNYLKGVAGPIALDDEITLTNTVGRHISLTHSSGTVPSYIGQSSASLMQLDVNRDPVTGTFSDTGKSHAKLSMDGNGTASFITFAVAAAANTLASEKARINPLGLGVGITPQHEIHTHGGVGGSIFFDADAVAGSAVTVIADGTGDVLYRLMAMFVVRDSGGATSVGNATSATLTPGGGDQVLHTSGADSFALRVNANGSVDVRRSAGTTLTAKISLWCLWL